jgi:hypothetical protein
MVCPYRKRIDKVVESKPLRLDTVELEEFPECQGNECPFYDQRIGCRRAMKEIGYLEERYE